jgi:hypothetical protein
MKTARSISYGMTALGVALTLAGALFDLSPVITVSGLLLVVAGVVKIGMVAIWQVFFRIPPPGSAGERDVTEV